MCETREVVCGICTSVLGVSPHDISADNRVKCPCCGNSFSVAPEYEEDLDFRYPEDFYSFAMGKEIPDEQIMERINHGIDHVNNQSGGCFYCWATGNTHLSVLKYEDGEIDIIVSKGYELYNL